MTHDNAARNAYWLSVVTMLLLLLGSAVWYRERMLFVDPAFVAFEVINRGGLVISEHRYGAFITQVFPLVGSWLQLPLRNVLFLYSVSFYLFFLTGMLLVGWRWRQYALGTLLALYFTLFVSDVYFWPNNEVHQAVGWMVLFMGYYLRIGEYRRVRWWHHLVLLGLLWLATVSHPLVAAPLAFLWAYLHLCGQYRDWLSGKRAIAYTLAIAAGIAGRYLMSRNSWYDGQKLGGVKELSLGSMLDAFRSGQADSVLHYLGTYWPAALLVAIGLYGVFRYACWWLALGTLGAAITYFGLVCITYPMTFGRDELYYFESEWMALALVIAAPFVITCLGRGTRVQWGWGVLLIVYLTAGVRIYRSHDYFATRLDNLGQIATYLAAGDNSKVIVADAVALKPYFGPLWGLSTESLLAGQLVQGRGVTLSTAGVSTDALPPTVFRANFRPQPISTLNHNYFTLDTLTTYRTLGNDEVEPLIARLRPLPK